MDYPQLRLKQITVLIERDDSREFLEKHRDRSIKIRQLIAEYLK